MTDRRSAALVGAVLAGESGDVTRAVDSLFESQVVSWVFDTTSTNRHRALSRDGVTVVPVSWPNSFATARNDALRVLRAQSEASCVLWLDSDEVLGRTSQATLRREAQRVAKAKIGLCPTIAAGAFATQGVARLHSLRNGVRFRGHVHEYLEDDSDAAIAYEKSSIRIVHDDYGDRDRSQRNDALSRRQIAEDPINPRWRPFWIRDAGMLLSSKEIILANKQQVRLSVPDCVGGIELSVYCRMIAWHTAWHLVTRGAPDLVERELAGYRLTEGEVASELLYLRLIALAIAGLDASTIMVSASVLRQTSLADGREYPWLDAGIACVLDASGRHEDADAYRAESVSFTDAFCEDSRLRPEFARAQLARGAFSRR